MDYFRILDLNKEPFSNSPEPESFFPASQYATSLQQLELAVRLRRGLNVIVGEIGVGKSTLCRQLVLRLSAEEEDRQQIETHVILDPSFGTPREFLSTVAEFLEISSPEATETDWQLKERIKNRLFRKGVEERKIVVLIIDEGQKLPDFCLELLREFLNYETNQYKLLQILIFAQPEFEKIMNEHANFADRINYHGHLGPLTAKETAEMIQYRILKAASGVPPILFTRWGLRAIYRATGGYPRKVIHLCHKLVLAMVIKKHAKAGWFLVRSTMQTKLPKGSSTVRWVKTAATVILLALFLSFIWNLDNRWQMFSEEWQTPHEAKVGVMPEMAPSPALPPEAKAPPQAAVAPDLKRQIQPDRGSAAAVLDAPPKTPRAAPSPPTTPDPPSMNKEKIVTPDQMPKMLGQLAMRKDGSVLRLIRKIYGVEDADHLDAVADANPQINDINVVAPGRAVNFPALPVSWKSDSKKAYRVQVIKQTDLKRAYSMLELYSPELPAAQLLPYWNSREGLVFAILLKEVFADEKAALGAKMQLPPALEADAKIREAWDKDTVFFARP